jgi:hypothetical protein
VADCRCPDCRARVLVAGLEGERTACQGASWARAIELPDPKLEAVRDATPAMREAALRELRKLPAYADIRIALPKPADPAPAARPSLRARLVARRAAAHPVAPEVTNWDEAPDARVEISVTNVHGSQLVSVSAQAGAGCIGQSYQLWALWQVSGSDENAEWRLVSSPRSGQGGTARALVDLDGDGTPEIVFVPTGMGELLGIVRPRALGPGKGVGADESIIYDDFEVNRLPVLDSSC